MGHLITLFQKIKIILRDSFNRPDGPLGIANSGQTWTYLSGSAWTILSNQAKPVLSETSIAVLPANSDGAMSANLTFSVFEGLCFRVQDASNFLYIRMNTTSIVVGRRLAGTFTTIGSFNSTFTVGQVYAVRVVFFGTTMRLYLDGVLVVTVLNETNFATATQCGLFAINSPSGRYDNFLVEAL